MLPSNADVGANFISCPSYAKSDTGSALSSTYVLVAETLSKWIQPNFRVLYDQDSPQSM